MAQPPQEDGWPLGLQPLNVRVGLVRNNRDMNGSISFNTVLTGSPTSTDSSSDLDTESTGSFFHDRSITLGTLLGVSNILELSRRSTRGRRRTSAETLKDNKKIINSKPKTWLFSLCSKLSTDAVTINNNHNNNDMAPSLGHFLESERRAAIIYRRNQNPNFYGPDDFSGVLPVSDPNPNTLFVSDHVAPPTQCSNSWSAGVERSEEYGAPLLLSCLCGHLTH